MCSRIIRDALTERVRHVGPNGAGARAKLVINLVLGLNRLALAEGLLFGLRQGLDGRALLAVLKDSGAYSRAMDLKGERMVEGNFEAEGKLVQHLKDVELMLEVGHAAAATRRGPRCWRPRSTGSSCSRVWPAAWATTTTPRSSRCSARSSPRRAEIGPPRAGPISYTGAVFAEDTGRPSRPCHVSSPSPAPHRSRRDAADVGRKGVPVSRMPSKSFTCSVVSETVAITLRRRNSMAGRGKLFVACSEKDCQYIDENEPPCPLTLALFTDEINERMIAE